MIEGIFTHDHNAFDVAAQEYELAKQHHREVLMHLNAFNLEHQWRFSDAQERLEAARERYLTLLATAD
jgi:hypothetical protein